MKIVIHEPPEKVSLTMKSERAPCIGCKHREIPDVEDGISRCRVADQHITGRLIEECLEKGWRKPHGLS